MIAKKTPVIKLRRYQSVKIGLGCLFVGTLLNTSIFTYLLFSDGITIGRLAVLAVLMVISYIDGAFSGSVCRKIEAIKEEIT